MSNFLVGNTNYAPVWKDHGTGGGTSYTLDGSGTAVGTLVYVGGSIQEPGVDYTISGTAITMTTSVTAGIGVLTCQLYALGTVNVPVDNSVTAAKTDLTLAEGSMIYGTGADAWSLLAKGAASQQLAMNAGATAPEWVTVSGGGWEFVSLTTASSDATVAFTSLATGYDYMINIVGVLPVTDAATLHGKLGIAGPTYRSSNYVGPTANLVHSGTVNTDNTTTTHMYFDRTGHGNATDENGQFEVILYDPANASTDTYWISRGVSHNSSTLFEQTFAGGHYTTSEAHTAIQFLFSSGNISVGEFKLYRRANA